MDLKQRTSNTIKNTVIGLAAQTLQVLSSFICRIVFVHILTESYLGVNELFNNILSILSLGSLGIGSAVTFELYRTLANNDKEETKAFMAFYKKAYSYVGIAIGIFGIFLFPFINRLVSLDQSIHGNVYVMYALYLSDVVISYFFTYKASIIEASQQNYKTSAIHAAVTIFQNIIQCVVLILARNFMLYLAIQIGCSIGYNILVAKEAERSFPYLKEPVSQEIPPEHKKRMFFNIRDIFMQNIAGKLMNSTDNIIITALGGLANTGLNSNYSLLYATLVTFTTKIQLGIAASVGNVNAVEDKDKRIQVFNEVHFMFFWMYFWCALCFILLVQDVIGLFFGQRYLMSFSIAVITGLNFYIAEEGTVVTIFKETMGLFSKGKYVAVATGIINVILSVVLGKQYGVFGVLLATFVSRMITTRWYLPFVTFKYGFKASGKQYYLDDVKYWIEGIAIFFITYYLCRLLPYNGIGLLFLKAVICLIVPNVIIIGVHWRDPYFITLKERILNAVILRRNSK